VQPCGEAWDFLSSADLVVVEYAQHYALPGLLPLLARGKPRILFDYHGVTPRALWGNHNHEALERGVRSRGLVWCADAALVHSRFMHAELTRATGFPAERVFRLAHPVDTSSLTPDPPVRSFRQELGLPHAALVLFVGRLAPNKRLPVLVEALAELREWQPPIHALVVGDTTDLYQGEARRCRRRALALGVEERVHFLGHLSDDDLRDAYRSADVFVMPSRHEGFCIPVVEAMACGLPVIAARAAALPETVAGAGLSSVPDDAADLARQLRRVLSATRSDKLRACPLASPSPQAGSLRLRVGIVSFRYGGGFAGGAERSLRTIAEALHQAGHCVDVFTTCATGACAWANDLPEGTSELDGIPLHRFRIDPYDRDRHLESVRAILESKGPVSAEVEHEYRTHSIRSTALIEALRQRLPTLDALIVGPYLHGLSLDVAQAFPDQTLLLACLHDEPFARLECVRRVYERAGGILYHSPEERDLAEAELGLNHPRSTCVGTLLHSPPGDPERGQEYAGAERYVVYCGRYSQQKDLPALLDHARRFCAAHPGRFTFVFLGEGEVPIPREPWARDLGFVDDTVKRHVLAGADALLLPSRLESLSLAALEAWAQGTPVVADARCPVLVGHLQRGAGGRAVAGYEAFAAALDNLWEHPETWRELGRRGQEYVRSRYADRDAFTTTLQEAIRSLRLPLAECMIRRGRERALTLAQPLWRTRFGRLVEEILDAPPRACHHEIDVRPRAARRTARAGTEALFVPVRVVNRGTAAALGDGPAAVVLRATVVDESDQPVAHADTPLPALLMPGRALSAAVHVPVPDAGAYRVIFQARPACPTSHGDANDRALQPAGMEMSLVVGESHERTSAACCGPLLETVQAALAEAHRLRRLPDDYTDVTEGWFAAGKRWIKRKLLGNFRRAYVDVLSRQQSACNEALLNALHELSECCATLDHAVQPASRAPAAGGDLARALAETRARCQSLEERLARLETAPLQEKGCP
jgi:glycosyltransferase involved in cell wall biosynthesis